MIKKKIKSLCTERNKKNRVRKIEKRQRENESKDKT